MSLIESILKEVDDYMRKQSCDFVYRDKIKSIIEKHLKQSENVDKRMCSKCHKVHTDKQPNQNISFVCDDCIERV